MNPDPVAAAGLDPDRLAAAYSLLESWALDGSVPGAAIAVGRRGRNKPL